jgi:hypothetical protein
VAKALLAIAEERGIACFDLFAATGGKGSSKNWYQGKWMARDRIHFTRNAYHQQGALLYRAIMNSKNNRQSIQP